MSSPCTCFAPTAASIVGINSTQYRRDGIKYPDTDTQYIALVHLMLLSAEIINSACRILTTPVMRHKLLAGASNIKYKQLNGF